ncbi:MAG TPA: hypothetical protein VFL04_01305 [Rectinemataceae bacterium]|nr:hypothetical protein [Rectinemataceae bacterium]
MPELHRGRAFALAALALLASSLIGACGGKPPELAAVEWRLEQRQSKAGPYESLWVFASVKDSEGIDDLDALYVVNDAAGIDWRLTNANWTKRTEGGDTWIGAADLALNDYGPLPRGGYRAMAMTAAGERAERAFSVEGQFPDYAAPRIEYSKGQVSLRSAWPETLIIGLDGTGAVLGSSSWTGAAESLGDHFGVDIAARVAAIQAYGYEPSRNMGSYSERVVVK